MDTAEPIAWAGAVAGTAVGIVWGQMVYGLVPVALAISSNLTNRYRRLQQIQPETMAVIERSQQLHGELQALQSSLKALPLTQRLQSLEDSLSRVSEAVVQIQQRQEDFQSTSDRDRQQIKEAFTILKRGVVNLNNHTHENFSQIRGDIDSVRLSLATLLETQLEDDSSSPAVSSAQVDELVREIARLQEDLQNLSASVELAPLQFPPLQSQIDGLGAEVERLDRRYGERIEPGLKYLARTTRKLQQQQSELSWLGDIDRRLEAVLSHQYRLVGDDRDYLLEGLEQARSAAIVVSPWLRLPPQEGDRFWSLLEAALQRQVWVSLGWGDPAHIGRTSNSRTPITLKPKGWRYHPERDRQGYYSALPRLLEFKKRYNTLNLKLLGTREKLVACDGAWMLLGGGHLLCAEGEGYRDRPPLGLYTTDPQTIATAVDRFKILAAPQGAALDPSSRQTVRSQ